MSKSRTKTDRTQKHVDRSSIEVLKRQLRAWLRRFRFREDAASSRRIMLDYSLLLRLLDDRLRELDSSAFQDRFRRTGGEGWRSALARIKADYQRYRRDVQAMYDVAIVHLVPADRSRTGKQANPRFTLPDENEILSYVRQQQMDSESSKEPIDVRIELPEWALPKSVRHTAALAAERLESLGVEALGTELDQKRAQVLSLIAVRSIQNDLIRKDLDSLVEEARALDTSWRLISKAAGVTPQAAHSRWDPAARERHREYQKKRYGRSDQAD